MKYLSFEIVNFKGIQELRVDLNGPPDQVVTIVGLNESGKTTILEAISQFDYASEEFASLMQDEDAGIDELDLEAFIPVAKRANFNGKVAVRAQVELDEEDVQSVKDVLTKRRYRNISMNTSIQIEGAYHYVNSRYDRLHYTWSFSIRGQRGSQKQPAKVAGEDWQEAVRALIPRMMPIRYFPNTLFDFPQHIYLEPRSDSLKETFYRKLLDSIVSSLGIDANVEEHLIRRSNSPDTRDKTSLDSLLLTMSRALTSTIFGAWNEIFRRKIDNKAVTVDLNVDDWGRKYVRIRIQDEDGYFDISERSVGFRWFFVYLLLTSYPGTGSAQILFMFDEPASNLHPTAQQELLAGLGRLSQEHRVIYTTHSHHLINPDWLESALVARNSASAQSLEDFSAAKTRIELDKYRSFAAKHPNQGFYFQPILDMLDFSPSRLDLVPSVVMMEGKNDFYTLRLMQKVLDTHHDLALMPGGGAGSLDAVIQLYLGWSRSFIILLDSDAEGRKQANRYGEKFGPVLNGRIFTLGDLSPDWQGRAMEGMFSTGDRIHLQELGGGKGRKFDKKLFNRVIQEFAAGHQMPPLSEATRSEFRLLITRVADALRRSDL